MGVLWLSRPGAWSQDDNGYDISDYWDIDPLFSTLEDMDKEKTSPSRAHKRGLRIVMDLVVSHTSDEHAWFQASRDKNDPHADWYWWRPAKPGHEPNARCRARLMGLYFGGSAWEYDPESAANSLFPQFSKKQPDLNWENPEVRKENVYKMMNWWMDRGIDGFRMDVITLISKKV